MVTSGFYLPRPSSQFFIGGFPCLQILARSSVCLSLYFRSIPSIWTRGKGKQEDLPGMIAQHTRRAAGEIGKGTNQPHQEGGCYVPRSLLAYVFKNPPSCSSEYHLTPDMQRNFRLIPPCRLRPEHPPPGDLFGGSSGVEAQHLAINCQSPSLTKPMLDTSTHAMRQDSKEKKH